MQTYYVVVNGARLPPVPPMELAFLMRAADYPEAVLRVAEYLVCEGIEFDSFGGVKGHRIRRQPRRGQ